MKFFVGRNQQDTVSLGNGNVLCCLQQFSGNTAIDRINRFYFPFFDRDSQLLGENGSFVMCKDRGARIWYDPNSLMRRRDLGEWGGHVSIDSARFLDGAGLYEVVSHKGYNTVRTTTWVPDGINCIVRKIEVKSHLRDKREFDVYACLELLGKCAIFKMGKDWGVMSRVRNYMNTYVGVMVPGAVVLRGDFLSAIKSAGRLVGKTGNKFVFKVGRNAENGKYCSPAYLAIAFAKSEKKLRGELEKLCRSEDLREKATVRFWDKWIRPCPVKLSGGLNYLWRVSQTVPKLCIQKDGTWTMGGFENYLGSAWVRDSIWTAVNYAAIGHSAIARLILKRLFAMLKKLSPP